MGSAYRIALDGIPTAGHCAGLFRSGVDVHRDLLPWWNLGCLHVGNLSGRTLRSEFASDNSEPRSLTW